MSVQRLHSQCFKKKRYKSLTVAEKVMQQAMRERDCKLRTYYCGICNGYHLTHRPLFADNQVSA